MADQPKPLILMADDEPGVPFMLSHYLAHWGYDAATALTKTELLQELDRREPTVLLLDLHFGPHDGIELTQELLRARPGLCIVLLTGNGSIDSAVTAIKLGAYDYLTKPPDLHRLQVILGHVVEQRRLRQRIARLEQLVDPAAARPLWGESKAVKALRDLIATLAPTDATGLILGESGTGKELVARALHDGGPRRNGPFVPVNVAALPRELVESVLFGHEKGAFTGADRPQVGCCEAADGGTLFLDEIGDMDPALQVKLLRFLQERTVQPVGSAAARPVDVRVVAATNRDLREAVRAGQFREDLYYRLNVVPIEVPPLRDRRADVPLLADRFLRRAADRHGKDVHGFGPAAVAELTRYDWPGNVRQLENLVERLVILARGPVIDIDALPAEVRTPAAAAAPAPEVPAAPLGRMDLLEKQAIEEALRRTGGNVGAVAQLLGIGQATAYRKIKRYGIARPGRPCVASN